VFLEMQKRKVLAEELPAEATYLPKRPETRSIKRNPTVPFSTSQHHTRTTTVSEQSNTDSTVAHPISQNEGS
ncbi:hypothetical protein ACUWC2_28670, partial [Klebsiella pneumoniae]|uniref:hypothetical protein n=1 Tax=Klebsiella pneumoniae TaxID=573 RepID=UPI0040558134